jgi:hypothetical protein
MHQKKQRTYVLRSDPVRYSLAKRNFSLDYQFADARSYLSFLLNFVFLAVFPEDTTPRMPIYLSSINRVVQKKRLRLTR